MATAKKDWGKVATAPQGRNTSEADGSRWLRYATRAVSIALILLGTAILFGGKAQPVANNSIGNASAVSPAKTSPASYNPGQKQFGAKPIQEIRLGERVIGRNPIREEAELEEPEAATWRKIGLHMTKESGHDLWIELLRPLTWVEDYEAQPGATIFIGMIEMGAVGNAVVTHVEPCPEILPATQFGGTVVTGTFKHQADAQTKVVQLKLEDQLELTGVTANHPYWSADRQNFIEAGQLRVDELVDTQFGLKRVVAVTPIDHDGFLYNLETTEHVYRVGSLGTLVHNSCIPFDELAMWRSKIGYRKDAFTLAKLEIGGHEFFGKSFGKKMGEVYPFSNVNNISKFHAEGDVIGQALREGVIAKEAKIFIDRALCRSCGELHGLRNMAKELGIERLYVYEKIGSGVSVFRIKF